MDPNPVLLILLYILTIFGAAAKPSPYRWIYFLLVAAPGSYLLFHFPIELISGIILTASDYLVLTDVQRELRLLSQHKNISDEPMWERLKWATKLICSARGMGWAHEPTAVLPPSPKHANRTQFVISRVLWILYCALLFDIGQVLVSHNHSFKITAPPMAEQGLLWRSYTMFSFLVVTMPFMAIGMNLLPSIAFVTTGFSHQRECPHLFGSLAEAYTVRRFWNRTWHQMLRRLLTAHGKYIAHNILRLTPSSKSSVYVQVIVAFFLSGLIHTRSRSESGGLQFFLLQSVAIISEDVVFSMAKSMKIDGHLRSVWWLGYLWVWFWFLYSFPYLWDSMLHTGMLEWGKNISFFFLPSRFDWLIMK